MNRFVLVFLSFAYLSVDCVQSSNEFIRLPLISRRRRAANENGLTTVTAESSGDVDYGVPIEIGTPPQKFMATFDTGSADLWVSSANSYNTTAKHLFDAKASSTFQQGNGDFFLGYVGASIGGTIGVETVSIGGLTIKDQPFGLANTVTAGVPFDGIMGFSYPSVAQTDNSSMIDRLYEQGQVKKRIACVKFRLQKKSKSEVILGGCDVEAKHWIPVMEVNGRRTGWRVKLTKIILRSTADNSELLNIEPNNEAVLDTGGGGSIAMPSKFLSVITDSIAASWNGQHYLVDCANRTSLPNIEFYFGEAKLTMTLDDYSWTYFDQCQIGFAPGGKDFLFGSTFFNQATVIFDRDNNRVGLAPR